MVKNRTRKIPWAVFVNVDLFDEFDGERLVVDFATEVEVNELFVCRVEAEARKGELVIVGHVEL